MECVGRCEHSPHRRVISKAKSCQVTYLVAVRLTSSGGGISWGTDGVRHLGSVYLECDVSYVKWCRVSKVIELTKEAGDVDKMSHNLE